MSETGDYAAAADRQLCELEDGPDVALCNAVYDACELIFSSPRQAQMRSTAIQTDEGVRLVLPVAGHPPWKVVWRAQAERIEAVMKYETAR